MLRSKGTEAINTIQHIFIINAHKPGSQQKKKENYLVFKNVKYLVPPPPTNILFIVIIIIQTRENLSSISQMNH